MATSMFLFAAGTSEKNRDGFIDAEILSMGFTSTTSFSYSATRAVRVSPRVPGVIHALSALSPRSSTGAPPRRAEDPTG